MKKKTNNKLRLLYFIYILFGGIFTMFAQTKGISYQAYITSSIDVPGEGVAVPMANTEILLEFVIKDEIDNIEYIEHIPVITDQYGLASTIVGAGIGSPQDGTDFEDIDWNGRSKSLNVGVDFSNSGIFSDHDEMPLIYMPQPATSRLLSNTGSGAPTATSPANPSEGDIYVDESTGDLYTYDGNQWVAQSDVVSTDANNIVVEGTDGLAFLDIATLEAATGNTTGSGAPTATSPANPSEGDIYVDESTGDLYTYDGNQWVAQSDVVSTDANNIVVEGTDGLAFLDIATLEAATGNTTGSGAPTATSPANPSEGDIYVDESTGDLYTYDGNQWVAQSDVVSTDANNIVVEGTDGLAFLDIATLEAATGNTTGSGAPTATSPANPSEGDIYVDESTGDLYTYDGNQWVAQSDVVSTDANNIVVEGTDGLAFLDIATLEAATGNTTGSGAPTATSPANPSEGDIYVDESTGDLYTYDGNQWVAQSDVVSTDANNIVVEGTDGLAYLDASAIGIVSGDGIPTATNPANPTAGDVYVDENTGDIYTYDGTDWISKGGQSETGTGAPTDTSPSDPTAGDIYVDESTGDIYTYDGNQWVVQGAQGETGPAGVDGTDGTNGQDGADGNGIASSADNGDGTFTLTFDDGTTFTTSDLTGPTGATGAAGAQGPQGIQGETGPAGVDGTDGNGIASSADNGDGTFTLTFDDGTTFTTSDLTGPTGATGAAGAQGPQGIQGETGPAGADGTDGNGIASSADNGDGTFTLTFDDGTTFTTADLTGADGAQGETGPAGVDGTDGTNGQDGADGNGIASSADNGDGTFTLTFDDGTTFTTADLTGPAGATGADGAQGETGPAGVDGTDGTNGQDGADGNGIASSADNGDGTFTLTFDDGTTFTTADLTGPAGAQGDDSTDDQTLSLTGTTLAIENGNNIDLSAIDTDTDDQTASEVSLNPNLDIDGDGTDETTVQQALADLLTATKLTTHVFHAEYAGAVFDADGSNNSLYITSDYSSSGFMNYYEINNEETSGSNQDYDIVLQYTLPNDFNSWTSSNPMTIAYEGTSNANFQVAVLEGNTTLTSSSIQSGSGLNGFSSFVIASSAQISALAAGDKVTILLKITVSSVSTEGTSIMRLGDITFNYNRDVL